MFLSFPGNEVSNVSTISCIRSSRERFNLNAFVDVVTDNTFVVIRLANRTAVCVQSNHATAIKSFSRKYGKK